MICAWKEFLSILPSWLRQTMDKHDEAMLQELRLRLNSPPELVTASASRFLGQSVTSDDLQFCINSASRYSPWNASSTASGYLTAPGGHRIGICGEAVCHGGVMSGIREVTSVCIRVARDFPGIAKALPTRGSVLILGAPGSGKTTLLRDLIRQRSDQGEHVSVVDERKELFPVKHFSCGKRTDVLSGCSKAQGIIAVLRAMGPDCIAVDEITSEADSEAMLQALWCGTSLLATAHASSLEDFFRRTVYRDIVRSGLFTNIVTLRKDKTWILEGGQG